MEWTFVTFTADLSEPGRFAVTNRSYTPRDELLVSADPTHLRTSLSYFGTGRMKTNAVTGQSGGATTQLAYVSTGALKSYTPARGGATQHNYDESARRYSTVDALGFITTYLYTPAGDLQTIINARGAITTMLYDVLHRPVTSRGGRRAFRRHQIGSAFASERVSPVAAVPGPDPLERPSGDGAAGAIEHPEADLLLG